MLLYDPIGFETRCITNEKEGHFIIIKRSTEQEIKTTLNLHRS